jgi:hypothetical protein
LSDPPRLEWTPNEEVRLYEIPRSTASIYG